MSEKHLTIFENKAAKKATMLISGYISQWENSSKEITSALAKLEADHDDIEIVLMNCYGGSIYEGIPTYDAIKRSTKNITTVAEGLVASMGTVLYMAGKHRKIAKTSRLMIHKASGGAQGDSDKLREVADEMDRVEADMVLAYAEATGKTEEEIKAMWMIRGKDTYIKSDEAKELGLCHEIIDGQIKKDLPKSVQKTASMEAIASFYNQQFLLINKQTPEEEMKNLGLFIAALSLAADATEEMVLSGVNALAQKNKDLEEELSKMKTAEKEARKVAIKQMVAKAKTEGKITEAQVPEFEAKAEKDFDTTKWALDQIKAHTPISAMIGGEKGQTSKHDGWDFVKFQKEDPKALERMRTEEPDRFKALKDEYLSKRG